ncbi:MAG: Rne/Rng family ribonuclease [Actinobacteria bacterium]|nr:Rne/Rng family ribonuclease [Actinomycetota bacterium]
MLDSEDTNLPTAEVPEPVPPRRRRAASRPAGPPQPVVMSAPAAPTLPEPELESESVPPVVADAPVVEPVVETKPKRTRRAKATEPVAEVAEAVVAAEVEPVAQEATAAEPAPVAKTTRRRRGNAAAEPVAEPAEDVAASLESLARETGRPRARTGAIAETFGLGEEASPDQVLDSLAAAIGGLLSGAAEEDPEADEDDETEVGEDDQPEDAEETEDGEEGDAPRRRRRRRGGRRRRRGGAESDPSSEGETEGETEVVEGEAETDTEADSGDETAAETSSSRRRRRRRRGDDSVDVEDDSVDVVVRVREPRRRGANPSDEVTGIEGSTRMEAKKQRRREGRAAGRRRTPILSESEFLARREAVDRKMLIRQAADYSQIAVLEDNVLVEHYVDRASATSMIGNIYLGRVQNVLPSMEAAFVDIGRGRNAVLYAGEVDWDSFGVSSQDRKVEKVFKSGQQVLVQVSKDPVGAKGARLTSHLSIPGRYIVYSPGGHLSGISRKLPEGERKRLKGILDELIGPDASVIVRTAAEGASEEELVRDVNRLKAQWEVLEKKSTTGSAPQQLYAEPDLTVRIVRDLFTEDFGAMVIDGNGLADDAYDNIAAYVQHVAPHMASRMERWDRAGKGDLFENFRVHEQVAKALERKVFLPSGGSLIIDRTEAMTVVDVNTGKFTGTTGNLEATVTSNNLEAAEEIVRQLRLRDIGGIIVIDFIDMVLPANRELLLRRLVECLGRDRTRHQVAEVTSLGLVQMTRKKIGTGLAEAFTVACETCKGRGYHVHDAPVASQAPADGGDRDAKRRSGSAAKGAAVVAKSTSSTPRRASRSRKAEPKAEEPMVSTEQPNTEQPNTEQPNTEHPVAETLPIEASPVVLPVAEFQPVDAAPAAAEQVVTEPVLDQD